MGSKVRRTGRRGNSAHKHGWRWNSKGYDLEFTKAVADAVKVPVVASGGAGKLEHFYDAVTQGGASILLAASVFHYRTFSIRQVKEFLRDKGIPVSL